MRPESYRQRGLRRGLILQTLGQAGKGLHIGQGRDGQILVQGSSEHMSGKQKWEDHEQNIPGAAGGSGWRRRSAVPPGEPQSELPTGKSGQSPVSPGPSGTGPNGILDAKAQCTPYSSQTMLGDTLVHTPPRAGIQSRGLSQGSPKSGSSELLSLCQAVPDLSA